MDTNGNVLETIGNEYPIYSFEITTSAKGFHSFSLKIRGDDYDKAILDLKNATEIVGALCNKKNEGVKL